LQGRQISVALFESMVDLLDIFVVSLSGQSKVVLDRGVSVWQAAASHIFNLLLDMFGRVVKRAILVGICS
jgi:hypothetical protein